MIGIPHHGGSIVVLTYEECSSLLPYLDYSNAFFDRVDAPAQIRQGFEYLNFLMHPLLGRPSTRRHIRRTHTMRGDLDVRAVRFVSETYYAVGTSQRMKAIFSAVGSSLNWGILDSNFPTRGQTPAGLVLIQELIPVLTRDYANVSPDDHTTPLVLSLMLDYPWTSLFPGLFAVPADLTPWNTLVTGVITALATGGTPPTTLRKLLSLPEVSV